MAFVREKLNQKYRMVDRERGLALYRVKSSGGSSEDIDIYELHLDEVSKVCFAAKRKVVSNGGKGDVYFEIQNLDIVGDTHLSKEQLMNLITEVLDAKGGYWDRSKCDTVNVSFVL